MSKPDRPLRVPHTFQLEINLKVWVRRLTARLNERAASSRGRKISETDLVNEAIREYVERHKEELGLEDLPGQ